MAITTVDAYGFSAADIAQLKATGLSDAEVLAVDPAAFGAPAIPVRAVLTPAAGPVFWIIVALAFFALGGFKFLRGVV